jgi:RNA polymerase sigma-70 factor (ECF subfamily)
MTEPDRALAGDDRIRAMVSAGDVDRAVTAVVRELGPEVFGFLRGALGSDVDADEVFAAASARVWQSIAAFRWQCSLRTWVYVIARNEIARFADGAKRHNAGRVTPSELDDVVAAVRSETSSALRSEKRNKLQALRDELSVEDRTLLILRIDRDLQWDDIARAFLADDEGVAGDEIKREAARLRKRFQLVKTRLTERARQEGLIS